MPPPGHSVQANGVNGQLELTESVLRIKRDGVTAFLTHGLKGDKEILISQLSSVQFKNASLLLNGYIQFTFLGGQEAKGGLFEGTVDENTVMFNTSQQGQFLALKDELQKRMARPHMPQVAVDSGLADLEKLAELRDKGILTPEEFQKKKDQILGFTTSTIASPPSAPATPSV